MSDLQRTEEWHQDRCGKFTGSRFVDVLARSKKDGSKLKAWHDVVGDVLTERLTGFQDEGADAYAMRWGREVEPFAISAYEIETSSFIEQTGFIKHPKFDFVGASPDGLVGLDGGVEIKSPKNTRIHLERLKVGMDEAEFMPQVQGCLWVTGREWWDWISYSPRPIDPKLRLYIKRWYRDDIYIKKLEEAVLEAEAEVQNQLQFYETYKLNYLTKEAA